MSLSPRRLARSAGRQERAGWARALPSLIAERSPARAPEQAAPLVRPPKEPFGNGPGLGPGRGPARNEGRGGAGRGVPWGFGGEAGGVVEGGRKFRGSGRGGAGKAPLAPGPPNPRPAVDAPAGKKRSLHVPPVVAARR